MDNPRPEKVAVVDEVADPVPGPGQVGRARRRMAVVGGAALDQDVVDADVVVVGVDPVVGDQLGRRLLSPRLGDQLLVEELGPAEALRGAPDRVLEPRGRVLPCQSSPTERFETVRRRPPW